MRNIFYFLLIGILFFACNEEPQSENTATAAPAQTPPADLPETAVLTSQFWVVEHWVDMEVPGRDKDQKGRWYRFYENGTYDGGNWEDHNDKGTWFLKKGSKYTLLYTDSALDDLKDAEWEFQKSSDIMNGLSWVKTKNYGDQRPVACQLQGLSSIPTKVQYGIQ